MKNNTTLGLKPRFINDKVKKPESRLEIISRKLRKSWIFKMIAQFMTEKEFCRLQLLDKFFYDVQVPRLLKMCQVKLEKSRLHFLNQDYIILFDVMNFTKRKLKVHAENEIWPLDS